MVLDARSGGWNPMDFLSIVIVPVGVQHVDFEGELWPGQWKIGRRCCLPGGRYGVSRILYWFRSCDERAIISPMKPARKSMKPMSTATSAR